MKPSVPPRNVVLPLAVRLTLPPAVLQRNALQDQNGGAGTVPAGKGQRGCNKKRSPTSVEKRLKVTGRRRAFRSHRVNRVNQANRGRALN